MKYFLCFCIILTLFACKNKQSFSVADLQKPDSLISRSQMVRIITDVHLAEAAVVHLKNTGDKNKHISEDYYNAIFSKYKISRKNFESNFDYYKRDQEGFIKLYEDVIKNLERLKTPEQPKKQ